MKEGRSRVSQTYGQTYELLLSAKEHISLSKRSCRRNVFLFVSSLWTISSSDSEWGVVRITNDWISLGLGVEFLSLLV